MGRWARSWTRGASGRQADAGHARGAGRAAAGVVERGARGSRCWGARAATQPRGQLRHGHGCCDTTLGRAGWVSWVKLVHCAPGSVLTQFLEPV